MKKYFAIFFPFLKNNALQPLFLLIILLLSNTYIVGQNTGTANNTDSVQVKPRPSIAATRIQKSPKIDANLDDIAWQNAPIAGDFVVYSPKFGDKPTHPSEVKIVYDNEAIYVGAKLYDKEPTKISRELGQRDDPSVAADHFVLALDTYNDDQNGTRFGVTAAGVQFDSRVSPNGNDMSWDAVWTSEVKIVADGWIVEMKIPYMALRFPKKPLQTWGLNFGRRIVRFQNEGSTWSPLNPRVSGAVIQWGDLSDLSNIEPPLRLSLSPYLATAVENQPVFDDNGTHTGYGAQRSISGGLDLKWGINESFTLDATLIPNFGQVQSDNRILNLSPFEVRFEERRPFFTEGADLFSKGDIFYSRRIGGRPQKYYNVAYGEGLGANEVLDKNPAETQLLNATKLSGRTNSKLGIGVLNAVAAPTFATVHDTLTGVERQIQTSFLTNYNVLVFQQALKNNSEIYITNASTWRDSKGRDANVTAASVRLRDKKNRYEFAARGRRSNIWRDGVDTIDAGHTVDWNISKVSGNFNFSIGEDIQDDKWNPNDLGIFMGNNFVNHYVSANYSQYNPGKIFNQYNIWANFNHNMQYRPFRFMDYGFNLGGWGQFKNQSSINIWTWTQPSESIDIWESRTERIFKTPSVFNTGLNYNSDFRKKFAIWLGGGTGFRQWGDNAHAFWGGIMPRYRFSNRLNAQLEANVMWNNNQRGWAAGYDAATVTFGRRDITEWTNTLNVNYTFTPKSNITFRARHYWSKVVYDKFYQLNEDGTLTSKTWGNNQNRNQNFFNIDMVYTWQFAPGSFLNVIWKNAIDNYAEGDTRPIYDNRTISEGKYLGNLAETLTGAQTNSLTLKVIYFLDYQQAKKLTKKYF